MDMAHAHEENPGAPIRPMEIASDGDGGSVDKAFVIRGKPPSCATEFGKLFWCCQWVGVIGLVVAVIALGVAEAAMAKSKALENNCSGSQMMSAANLAQRAWERGDKAAYRSVIAADAQLIIPFYDNLQVVGFDKIWAVRESFAEPPGPTAQDTLVITGNNVTARSTVFNRTTGQANQRAANTFTFNTDCKIARYFQDVWWTG